MGLDREIGAPEGRIGSNIDGPVQGSVPPAHAGGVDPGGGKEILARGEVRRGKAQPPPPVLTSDDRAADRERPAQQDLGVTDLPSCKQSPDHRAAHCRAARSDRLDDLHGEADLCAEGLECCGAAVSPGAEAVIVPHEHGPGAKPFAYDLLRELVWRHAGKLDCERLADDDVEAELGNERHLGFKVRDDSGRPVRGQDL